MNSFIKKLLTSFSLCFFAISSLLFVGCAHQHSFSNTYNKNAEYHWKVCTSGDNCDHIDEYKKHTFGEWETLHAKTCENNEILHRSCQCGYEETKNGLSASHNKAETLSYNQSQHWYECLDCQENLFPSNHNYSQWQTLTPATCTSPEILYRDCICSYRQTKEGEMLEHSQVAGLKYDENYHWNSCSNCQTQLNKTEHTYINGICKFCHYGAVASIGPVYYKSFYDAINSITDRSSTTIITLFDNIYGPAVQVPSGNNIMFDLNGYTYTITQPAVGSAGTTTSGFHLLKNSNITFKNGTITHATKYTETADNLDIQILIQNYCNLTLDNVTLDARSKVSNAEGTCLYALSNNFGNITIKRNTNIIADVPRSQNYGGCAFDLYYTSSTYKAGLTLTFDSTFCGTVDGRIEYTSSSNLENWENKSCLKITGGTFTANEFIFNSKVKNANIIITGGTFNFDVSKYVADGYICQETDGKYIVSLKH